MFGLFGDTALISVLSEINMVETLVGRHIRKETRIGIGDVCMVKMTCISCGRQLQYLEESKAWYCLHCDRKFIPSSQNPSKLEEKHEQKQEKRIRNEPRLTCLMREERALWVRDQTRGMINRQTIGKEVITNLRCFTYDMENGRILNGIAYLPDGVRSPRSFDVVVMNRRRDSSSYGGGTFVAESGVGVYTGSRQGVSSSIGDVWLVDNGRVVVTFRNVRDPNGIKSLIQAVSREWLMKARMKLKQPPIEEYTTSPTSDDWLNVAEDFIASSLRGEPCLYLRLMAGKVIEAPTKERPTMRVECDIDACKPLIRASESRFARAFTAGAKDSSASPVKVIAEFRPWEVSIDAHHLFEENLVDIKGNPLDGSKIPPINTGDLILVSYLEEKAENQEGYIGIFYRNLTTNFADVLFKPYEKQPALGPLGNRGTELMEIGRMVVERFAGLPVKGYESWGAHGLISKI